MGGIPSDSPVSEFRSYKDGMYIAASHSAYTFCCHNRSILFHRKKGLMIRDTIERGGRLDESHIQRWHLQPQSACEPAGSNAVIITKNQVRVLFLWCNASHIRLWKQDALCPDIFPSAQELPDIIDVSFQAPDENTCYNTAVSLTLLMLDVTETRITPALIERLEERLGVLSGGLNLNFRT